MRFYIVLFICFLSFTSSYMGAFGQCSTPGFDDIPPEIPVMDSISVNATTGNVILKWQPSTSQDTKGYFVYQFSGGVWVTVATITGINSTNYTYGSTSSDVSLDFRIAAFDSCNNVSPQGTVHKTMAIKVNQDKCNKTNTLTWNKYEGWSGIKNFYIYVSVNSGAQQLLGVVSGSVTSFVHKKIEPFSTYCYFVRAYDLAGTKSSLSHQLCYTATVYKVPDHLYLVTATVEDQLVKLIVHADKTAELKHYLVQRVTNNATNYKTIDTLAPSYSTDEITFYDSTAKVSESAYRYKLIAVDSCGVSVKTSENTVCTILLNATSNFDLTNNLTWNPFDNWFSGTKNYKLYRGEDSLSSGLSSFAFADTVYYDDNVRNFIIPSGRYCYQVEAQEADTNVYKYKATSRSNVFCVKQEPSVYVPNAFNPAGYFNPIFKPMGLFFDNENYSMVIFNRWGQKVFESNDPKVGWDGVGAEVGLYVYKIQYSDPNNKIRLLNGTVTLLR